MPPALALTGIYKRFGTTQALNGVDFSLEPGEIHALLGENGAGKSTLMKIAFGLLQPDAGTIAVGGNTIRLKNPTDARGRGIGMVHQHFTSIPAFTVAENVALAGGWRDAPRRTSERVRELARRTGLELEPSLLVRELSAGLKQRLEVLKALAADARVLLLDEPTSVLSPPEAESLLRQMAGFREHGVAAVLITHKLHEALASADRVTVLRRGRVVHSGATSGETAESLAYHMLGDGGEVEPGRAGRPPSAGGQVRIHATALKAGRLRDASFAVRAGELVGIAAVEGNGQRELLRVLAGLTRADSGELEVERPVAFIPEDRTAEALINDFQLAENLVLSQGARAPWIRGPWVDWSRARSRTAELILQYGVRASGPEATAGALSGGNQQRMVIAEALERQPAVLLAENPTRGLDIRATSEIMARLKEAASLGVAVLVHLGDLDELLALASRILVLSNGVLTDMPATSSREEIGRLMLGADGRPT